MTPFEWTEERLAFFRRMADLDATLRRGPYGYLFLVGNQKVTVPPLTSDDLYTLVMDGILESPGPGYRGDRKGYKLTEKGCAFVTSEEVPTSGVA